MKYLMTAIFAGSALAGSMLASIAAESDGVVASVDEATRTIVLEDGSTWTAAEGIDLDALAAGDVIKVTHEDGMAVVTAVQKM